MSESIYDKIETRISIFFEIVGYYEIYRGWDKEFGVKDWVQHFGRLIPFESPSYTIDFDQFKNEFPDKHREYLNRFLIKYVELDSQFDKLLSWQKNTNAHFDINRRSKCIKEIIIYLKGIVSDKNEDQESKAITDQPGAAENHLIFDEVTLDSFHGAFNGYLWESAEIGIFKNWFRVIPVGMPDFESDMKRYFCYAVWRIEDHIIPEYRPKNLNKWFESIIGKNNYSGLKQSKLVKEKKDEIDRKLNLLT